jgi:hypothetical protein
MCREMLESWLHFYTSYDVYARTVKLKLKLKVLFKTKLIGRNHSFFKKNKLLLL